jgi:hypothetical protein
MKIRYVVSAFSGYPRIKKFAQGPGNIEKLNQIIKTIDDATHHSIELNFLLNALTEKTEAKLFKEEYKFPTELFLDSGGLQMVTRADTLKIKDKEAEKLKVYEFQAQYGDYNMCFDEIPKVQVTNTSVVGAGFGILVDKYGEYGEKTAQNIIKQQEIFRKMKAKGKILAIAQLHKFEQTKQFIEPILNIPSKDYIGGIACGSAITSSYKDSLIDMQYFIGRDIPEPFNNLLHLLGVGSINRIIPFIILYRNGLLKFNELSFDSATASKGIDAGVFHWRKHKGYMRRHRLPKGQLREDGKKIFQEIYDFCGHMFFKDYDEFESYGYYWGKRALEIIKTDVVFGDEGIKIAEFRVCYIMYQIYNIILALNDVMEGYGIELYRQAKDKAFIKFLNNAKRAEDVLQFIKLNTRKDIPEIKQNHLEGW